MYIHKPYNWDWVKIAVAKKRKLRMDKEKTIGIVLILVLAILVIYSNIPTLDDSTLAPEQEARDILEEKGYEIIEVGYVNGPYVDMKSLGNREEQVWDGIWALTAYPIPENNELSLYAIRIRVLEPTQECFYSTYFTNFNSYYKSLFDEKIYVDEKGQLDRLNFDRVVELANEHFNQEYIDQGLPEFVDSFWNRYVESYPEVDSSLLNQLVKYQVIESENCE